MLLAPHPQSLFAYALKVAIIKDRASKRQSEPEEEKNSQRIWIASIPYKVNSVMKNERFGKHEKDFQ